MQRIRIKYTKGIKGSKLIRFIGHLDMVRLWERAIRRADIPVAYSEGFNPRQKLSFGPPLSLGIVSECELLDIYLENWISPEIIKDELNKSLPEGIEIIEARNIFSGMASLTAVIKEAEYAAEVSVDAKEEIGQILSSKEILVKRKDKMVNIRPMIKDLFQKGDQVIIRVQCDNLGTVKGQEITNLFKGIIKDPVKRTAIR